ncbi:MAG: response regulator transcription factor [Thiotrichales bacterium]
MNSPIDADDKPSLLLVDDDEPFRRTLARVLERRGFAVATAEDVPSARALAEADPPEYAVVDLKMPGDSGLVLVQALHRLDPGTRIVVLTGYASVVTAVEAIKLGAIHYLSKPVGGDEVVAALNKADGDPGVPVGDDPVTLNRLEWEHIQRVLADHGGNISATARALKLHRRTLQRKLGKRPPRG